MSGEIRRSRCYVSGTRDGVAEIHAAGLFSLLWDDFLSLFLSCRLLQTWHVWMRGGSAGQWGAPLLSPHSCTSICTLRCSVKWSRRRWVQRCLTDECFLTVSCAHQKKCMSVLGKDPRGDFWRSEVRASSLSGSLRSRSPVLKIKSFQEKINTYKCVIFVTQNEFVSSIL